VNKRIDYRTARVNWRMGLPLMPAHLYAQEESIREELYARAALQAAPAWGVARVAWDDRVRQGILRMERLVVILPSGVYLDIPGNAAAAPLDLTKSQLSRAPVYLHFLSGSSLMPDRAADMDDADDVEYLQQQIELSVSDQVASAAQPPLKLAEFECVSGGWSLSTRYIPPSLTVRLHFFATLLLRVQAVCDSFQDAIRAELEVNYLAADAHTAATHAQRGLWQLRAVLADIEAGVDLHPFEFYRELRAFYVEVCLFRRVTPHFAARPYRHENIADDAGTLLSELEALFSIPQRAPAYRELVTDSQGVRMCSLPRGLTNASDIILLVQKPHVSSEFKIGALKFASAERLPTVHARSLAGVTFEPLSGPPFYHGLSAAVEFYKPIAGSEWDHVVRERNLALSDSKKLEGYRFFLYTRAEAGQSAA
jgi:type VI secretion system protein ImpJ